MRVSNTIKNTIQCTHIIENISSWRFGVGMNFPRSWLVIHSSGHGSIFIWYSCTVCIIQISDCVFGESSNTMMDSPKTQSWRELCSYSREILCILALKSAPNESTKDRDVRPRDRRGCMMGAVHHKFLMCCRRTMTICLVAGAPEHIYRLSQWLRVWNRGTVAHQCCIPAHTKI